MPTLNLKQVPDPVQKYESVDVSEWFGSDEETGEPFTLNVYPLTVTRRGILTQRLFKHTRGDDGRIHTEIDPGADSSVIVTAICSYDSDGDLVFGVDYEDAIQRVGSLPDRYREMVIRVAAVALGNARNEKAVAAAEKN